MNSGLTTTIHLYCDGCSGRITGRTFQEVNALAVARGWIMLGRKQYCGGCAVAGVFFLVLGAALLEDVL